MTQAGVLAAHSLANQSSPVSRGKLVRERLLCQTPSPPPPNLNVTPPEVDPNLSTRERFAQHTESAECAGCHELMDPLGFAFESYDAVGRYRASDGGQPIDTSGWISGSTDADGPTPRAVLVTRTTTCWSRSRTPWAPPTPRSATPSIAPGPFPA